MKKTLHTLSIALISLLIHYGGFVENFVVLRCICVALVVMSLFCILCESTRQQFVGNLQDTNPIQWLIGIATTGCNLYMTVNHPVYFYTYAVLQLTCYAIVFSQPDTKTTKD